MAWNIPGNKKSGGSGNGGNAWRPRGTGGGGGDGVEQFLNRLRDQFSGGGGGSRLRWVGLLVALWLVFSSFVLVGEQDRGVVLRFGQFARIMQPGPNFKLPWPLERVTKLNTTGVRTFSNSVPVLTRDENIVTVSFNVQYRVSDPKLYMFGSRDADRVLQQVAQSAIREQIGRANLDAALNARGPLSAAAAVSLQDSLDAYRTGLVVTELSLQDARPPEEVKPAFDEVNSAQQMNERLVNEARAYAAKIVPEARGEAARTRTVAAGYKTAAIARASGDAARFSLLLDAYSGAPEVTRKRLWLETVEDVLANNRKVVGGDSRQLIYVPMAGAAGGGAGPSPVISQELVGETVNATTNDAPAVRSQRPTRDGAIR